MGGSAFTQASAKGEPTISTPRMSQEVYQELRMIYMERLRSYFPESQVASLVDAPEKSDYGDMDFVVARDDLLDFVDLANRVGARALICHHARMCTLAVSRDGSPSSKPAVQYKQVNGRHPSTTVTEEQYAQIDVEVIPIHLFEWHAFYASYGDMAGLLGHMLHNLGFTVSDKGLWLRMKELDDAKKLPYTNTADRDGTVFLSHEPSAVMRFLGLSVERYEAGFKTLDELYSWLGECRLLLWDAVKTKRDDSNGRNREQTRPVFTTFFNEWMPAHMPANNIAKIPSAVDGSSETASGDANDGASVHILHRRWAELVPEAVDFFDKNADFETKHNALVRNVQNAVAARELRPIIQLHSGRQTKSLSEIVRAFRRYVAVRPVESKDSGPESNERVQLFALETPHTDAESELWRLVEAVDEAGGGEMKYKLKNEAIVDEWVKNSWEELRALERGRSKGIAEARLEAMQGQTP